MKKTRLWVLAVFPLLLGACSVTGQSSSVAPDSSSSESTSSSEKKEPEGLVKKEIEVEMVSHFEGSLGSGDYYDTVLYDDHVFLEDPTTVNYGLAMMSAFADGSSYCNSLDRTGGKISAYLSAAGYTTIRKNEYYQHGVTLENSLGTIIAQKHIQDYNGKDYTLLAIFPRNAGYGAEWAGNFNLGKTGIHQGFLAARDEMLRFTKSYIDENKVTGDLKVWVAGYSRGAAAANLFGGYLAEDTTYLGDKVSLSPSNLFVYTIGTPRTMPSSVSKIDVLSVSGPRGGEYKLDTDVPAYEYKGEGTIDPTADKYKCIHNFTAIGDYITKLPPKEWSFTRYGVTEDVLYNGESFVAELEKLSPETASKFVDKNYSTELATKTVDVLNFAIKDTETKISPDALIEGRISDLMSLATDREGLVDHNYTDLLGAATSIFGLDWAGFYKNVTSARVSDLVKAGALTYLTYAVESVGKTDEEGLVELAKQIIELIGKTIEDRENYTDQQFLSDLLDFLFNDEKAEAHATILSLLIPAPYNNLYPSLLKCARDNNLAPKTVDGLLELLAKYIDANKEDEVVDSILALVAGLIPDQYASIIGYLAGKTYDKKDYGDDEKAMKKAIVLDLFGCMANGRYDGEELLASADDFRGMLLAALPSFVLSDSPLITNLLQNGSTLYGAKQTKDPAKLSELVQEILVLAMPKDGEGKHLTIKEAANEALVGLLESCKTEAIAKYVDVLAAHPDDLREIAATFLFNPGENYSLQSDVDNAVTLVDIIQFLFPAHNHEMYICYFKTQLSA